MNKADVRAILNENGLRQWELAEAIGISEYTLCKRLRRDLSADFEEEVLQAIEQLKERTE